MPCYQTNFHLASDNAMVNSFDNFEYLGKWSQTRIFIPRKSILCHCFNWWLMICSNLLVFFLENWFYWQGHLSNHLIASCFYNLNNNDGGACSLYFVTITWIIFLVHYIGDTFIGCMPEKFTWPQSKILHYNH